MYKKVDKYGPTPKLLIRNGARVENLSKKQYKMLLVVSKVYRQQQ